MKTVLKLSSWLLISMIVFTCSKKGDIQPTPTPPVTKTDTLKVTGISPDYGKAGVEITVTGTGFSATASENTVTIDGKIAKITSATTTQLKITAPENATHGAVKITVGKLSVSGPTFYYEPEITSVSIASGKTGDEVTITGKNFGTSAGDFEVKFNGVAADIIAATLTTLKVKVPDMATTGAITVARKTKAAVTGPSFSVTPSGNAAKGFTVTEGNITMTSILKSTGSYGSILCFTIDEAHDVMYAGTISHILKIDLTTNNVSVMLANSSFLTTGISQPSAMDVGPDGKLYLLADLVTVSGVPTTGGNVYQINTSDNTVKRVGNKYIGLNLGGALGDNVPFMVTPDNGFITMDGSIYTIVKYSADLSIRTVILTTNILESFSHLIKNTDNSIRIVTNTLFTKSYYDYKTSLSAKTDYAASVNTDLVSITRGGSSFYALQSKYAPDASATSTHRIYTIGKLNASQTGFDKKASFTIDGYREVAGIKNYNFIPLNGKTYFYADKNGNMYGLVLSLQADDNAGIVKFTIN
ncbi:MAG TPA: IPT/TIG domain-containing protein [Mucilaginibacter sp.]|nr:IPT/TIG domain-containing protein [Mucilaginibacter sp.]